MALIPLSAVQGVARTNTSVDLTAGARAVGSLDEVANTVGEYAQRVQDARDAADMVRAKNAMLAEETAFETWAQKEPDTEKWEEHNEQRIDLARTTIDSLNLSNRARQAVDVQLEDWAGKRRIAVANAARRTQAENAFKTLQEDMIRSADQGNMVGVEELVRQQEALGFLHPGEKDEVLRKMSQRAQVNQANRAMMEHPVDFLGALEEKNDAGEFVNWRGLDDNQRMQLRTEGRRQVSVLHAETVQGFQDRLNNGEVISRDELQTAVDQMRMTPQQMKNIMRFQSGSSGYAENVERMVELSQRITQWTPARPEAEKERHDIAAAMAGLPRSMQEPLETQLRKKAQGDVEASKTQDAETYIDWLRDNSFLGNYRKQGRNDASPGDYVDRQAALSAQERSLQLRQALRTYMLKHPEAGPEDQRKFIHGMIKGDKAKVGARSVLNAMTGKAP